MFITLGGIGTGYLWKESPFIISLLLVVKTSMFHLSNLRTEKIM